VGEAARIGVERMSAGGARRGWLWLCAGAATIIAVTLLGEALGGGPQGPVSSSYATDSQGLAAWAQLLSQNDHPVVQLRTPLQRAQLDPASTVVVLDPEALLPAQGRRLRAFVTAGGRLLIGGREPQGTLPALLPAPPTWSTGGSTRDLPVAAGAQALAGVSEVASAGEGQWESTGGYRTLLAGTSGDALLLERGLGRGRLALIADASPLQNRLLGSADNAQLALNLAGGAGRPVVFVESVHGFGEARGLAAVPGRWWLAFALLMFAGLLWILARARRLGPPERMPRAPAPPRGAYVHAIALLLRRTGQTGDLSDALTRLRDGR
jgi:hypothetical protein